MSLPKRPWLNHAAIHWANDVAGVITASDVRGRPLEPVAGAAILSKLGYLARSDNCIELSQKALAEKCRCSLRTVTNWLGAFERAGLIKRLRVEAAVSQRGRPSDLILLTLAEYRAPGAHKSADEQGDKSAPGAHNSQGAAVELDAPGAHNFSPSKDELSAPGACNDPADICAPGDELCAPGTELSAPGAHLLNNNNNTPLSPPPSSEAEMPVRDALTDIGVSADTAEALMNACAAGGHPLDMDTVWTMVEQLGAQDPEAEALRLLGNGLGNGRGRRKRSVSSDASQQAKIPTRRVNRDLEPDLWRRCCQLKNHKVDLISGDGGWAFPLEIVERAEREEAEGMSTSEATGPL